jgi:hypothetical protein
MRARRVLVPAAALLALAATAAAYNFLKTGTGKVKRWFTFYTTFFGDTASMGPYTTDEGRAFRVAAITWSSVPGCSFQYHVEDAAYAPAGADVNLAVNAPSASNMILGMAILDFDGATGRLKDADIWFNATLLADTATFDFETVALHELGHTLGLDHSFLEDPQPVMYPWYGGIRRSLTADDAAGVAALYPEHPNGELPVLSGMVGDLALTGTEVLSGDAVDVSFSVENSNLVPLVLQSLATVPKTSGPFEELVVPPGTPVAATRSVVVSEVPGVYALSAVLHGQDETTVYRASGQGTGPVTVRRDEIAFSAGDRVSAALGPAGGDRLVVWLGKGAKVLLEMQGDASTGMFPRLAVEDPEGGAPAIRTGRPLKARSSGFHALRVDNTGTARGNYALFTEPQGHPVVPSVRGAVPAGGPAEVEMGLFARSGGVLTVKGSRKLDLRITGLVAPDGRAVAVQPGAEVAVDDFGADGAWRVRVESATGLTGKFRVSFRGEWTAGRELAR